MVITLCKLQFTALNYTLLQMFCSWYVDAEKIIANSLCNCIITTSFDCVSIVPMPVKFDLIFTYLGHNGKGQSSYNFLFFIVISWHRREDNRLPEW